MLDRPPPRSSLSTTFTDLLPSLGPPFDATPPPRDATSTISRSHTLPNLASQLDQIPKREELIRRVTSNDVSTGTATGSNGGLASLMSPSPSPKETSAEAALVLEKYSLYETKTKFYVTASNQADSRFKVLKIDRTADSKPMKKANDESEEEEDEQLGGLVVTEDSAIYTREELKELLDTLSAGNAGGIQKVENNFYGIAGFVRFTSTYYMILIKSRAPVALIGGHYIYHCEETVLRPVSATAGARGGEEAKQYATFHGVDLSKNFYFSYTYDLTNTLQQNLTTAPGDPEILKNLNPIRLFNDKWVWNRHLLRPFARNLKGRNPWVLPLIHGYVDQAKLSIFGRTVYVTIVARRSRHFAGARFLKRGVNDQGYVANDVETEQIVSEASTTPFHAPTLDARRKPNPRYTSFVQVRGSIPLYWTQESAQMTPKPPIEMSIVDPYFSAAARHFDDLFDRYGARITILNLIKQKERTARESKLLPEFEQCIKYLNQFLPSDRQINFISWDLAAANKQRDKDVIGILEDIAEESIENTQFFHSGPEPASCAVNPEPERAEYRKTPLLQFGVIRTNCIDCLDRTNAAQFVVAKAALGHQLHALGIIHDPRMPFDSDAVNLITEMYHDHGDTIALQYGGSNLVNTMATYRKIGQWTSHSRDMIENIRRFYANSFVDADKQASIDLFLGIESSSPQAALHPSKHARQQPPRSYRQWYTPSHLEPKVTTEEAEARLVKVAEEESSSYWQSYYRPRLFTEFGRHFAFKVNSTLKYKNFTAGSDAKDFSPFIPRMGAVPPPRKPRSSGRWIAQRGGRTKLADVPDGTTSFLDDPNKAATEPSPPPSGSNTTESLVSRLLDPVVDPEEAREYNDYIEQFSHLSLGQELSEKDAMLYRASSAIAQAGVGANTLSVPQGSIERYREAVRVATPQTLRGS